MIPMGVEDMSLEDVRQWYAAKRQQGPLQEAGFSEDLHPRNRLGKWVKGYHGTLSKRSARDLRAGKVRPGFYMTTSQKEAADYAGTDLDPEAQGEVVPVTVHLRNPAVYHGARPRDAEQRARDAGHDGIIIHREADNRDPSAPLPARSWAIAFHPDAVHIGHHDPPPEEGDRLGAWVRDLGFPAYRVGGAVRDPMLGKEPKDIDYMVMADPHAIKTAVEANGGHVEDLIVRDRLVGVRAHMPGLTPPGDGIEIAPPRVEVSTGPGRKDFAIQPHPAVLGRTPTEAEAAQAMRDDALRRDFTVNAMYQAENDTGEVIDPLGGQGDMEARQLRTTSPASFAEDPLRILRGLRFMSQHGLALHPDTEAQMHRYAGAITALTRGGVSGTAVTELNKLLMGEHVGVALRKARETGALASFLPELAPTIGFDQRNPHHEHTLDEHTISVVERAAELGAPLEVRLAALFHDTGKVETNQEKDNGNLSFIGHELTSEQIARRAMGRLNYPKPVIDRVSRIIRHHMVQVAGSKRPARVRKWRAEVGPDLVDDLLLHRRADLTSKGEGDPTNVAELDRFEKLVDAEAGAPAQLSDLAITGTDLIEHGMRPGPEVGSILRELLRLVIADPSLNRREWLLQQSGVQLTSDDRLPRAYHGTPHAAAIRREGFKPGGWLNATWFTTAAEKARAYGGGASANWEVLAAKIKPDARVFVAEEGNFQTPEQARDRGFQVWIGPDVQGARDIVVFDPTAVDLSDESLQEATFTEVLHPRDRNGRWAHVIGAVAEGKRPPHSVAEQLTQPQRDALLKVLDRADIKDRRLRKLKAALKEWSVVHDNIAPTDMHSIIKMMLARREQHTGLV